MVQINFGQREVSCKIVFYGPGMSGKTTNLEIIHQKAPKQAVGEMVSIATETDRTLYFDFMPMDLGQVAGMHTKFMLYTVPGQIYYNATRKLVLQGVDGIIFVADSSPEKLEENLESLQNLRDNLAEMGLPLEETPLVLQYNKRDLPNASSVADLNAQLNPMNAPAFEAVAREGKGVFATLKEVSRLVIEKLNREHAPAANRRRTASSLTPVKAPATLTATPPRPVPQAPPARPMAPSSGGHQIARPAAPVVQSGGHAMPPVRRPVSAAPPSAPTPLPMRPPPPPPPPTEEDLSPREKHLAKAKPPALRERREAPVDLGATDPHLRRYQMQQRSGGSGLLKVLVTVLVGLIIAILILAIVLVLSPDLRERLPPTLKRLFGDPPAVVAPPNAQPAALAPPAAVPVPPPAAVSVPPASTPPSTPAPGKPDGQ